MAEVGCILCVSATAVGWRWWPKYQAGAGRFSVSAIIRSQWVATLLAALPMSTVVSFRREMTPDSSAPAAPLRANFVSRVFHPDIDALNPALTTFWLVGDISCSIGGIARSPVP